LAETALKEQVFNFIKGLITEKEKGLHNILSTATNLTGEIGGSAFS